MNTLLPEDVINKRRRRYKRQTSQIWDAVIGLAIVALLFVIFI